MTTTTPAPAVTVEGLNLAIKVANGVTPADATAWDLNEALGPVLWAIPDGATVRLTLNRAFGRTETVEGKVSRKETTNHLDGTPVTHVSAGIDSLVSLFVRGYHVSNDLNDVTVLALPQAEEVAA